MSSEFFTLVEAAIESTRRARRLAGPDTWRGVRADQVVGRLLRIEHLLVALRRFEALPVDATTGHALPR